MSRAHVIGKILPVGEELFEGVGFEAVAREGVRANLGALVQQTDADLFAVLGLELLEADRGGQACRASADDDDVVLFGVSGGSSQFLRFREATRSASEAKARARLAAAETAPRARHLARTRDLIIGLFSAAN